MVSAAMRYLPSYFSVVGRALKTESKACDVAHEMSMRDEQAGDVYVCEKVFARVLKEGPTENRGPSRVLYNGAEHSRIGLAEFFRNIVQCLQLRLQIRA